MPSNPDPCFHLARETVFSSYNGITDKDTEFSHSIISSTMFLFADVLQGQERDNFEAEIDLEDMNAEAEVNESGEKKTTLKSRNCRSR